MRERRVGRSASTTMPGQGARVEVDVFESAGWASELDGKSDETSVPKSESVAEDGSEFCCGAKVCSADG